VPENADAIISIHPGYAEAILTGKKTVELRRRVPALLSGSRLWIYATRPTAAVVGFVTIQKVSKADPATIWREHHHNAGIDLAAFQTYFEGTHEAVAILLAAAKRVGPITVEQLKMVRDSFHPPQTVVRLTNSEASSLRRMAKSE
jgi:predicted transcriptional regulator